MDGMDRTARVSETYGSLPGVFIHPRSIVESREVGEGTRVWANAHILNGAKVGRECNVCDCVFIEGGAVVGDRVTLKNGVQLWDKVTIEDEVFLGPNATFTNDLRPRAALRKAPEAFHPTRIKTGATIGANATIVCGITIGRYGFVGAGAVVRTDVKDHALVVGCPARQVGWACSCGETLPALTGGETRCEACGTVFREVDSGLEAASAG